MLFAVNVIFGAEKLGDQGGIISIHKMLVTNLRGPLGVKLNKSNIELIFTYYIIYFYLFLPPKHNQNLLIIHKQYCKEEQSKASYIDVWFGTFLQVSLSIN